MEKFDKRKANKYPIRYGTELDDVIKILKVAKEKEDNIYIDFMSIKGKSRLYSMFDDQDSCYKKVTGMTKSEFDIYFEEQIKKEAKKREIDFTCDLDDAVKILKVAKEKDENIYINFNGYNLYSMFDDEDSCYKKVTGRDKDFFAQVRNPRDTFEYENCDE